MEVFHYCASILKTTPLFETCNDSDIDKFSKGEGALYNNVDKDPSTILMPDSDFEDKDDNNPDITIQSDVEEISISDTEIDVVMLKHDEMDKERWVKHHPLFSTADDENYDENVKRLVSLPENEWKALPIYVIDRER